MRLASESVASKARLESERRHLRIWLRGTAVRSAVSQLRVAWLESVALSCVRALRSHAALARAARRSEQAALQRARSSLAARPALCAVALRTIAQWTRLLAGSAFRGWRHEVVRRRRLRPLLAQFAGGRDTHLVRRTFRAWSEAMWYAQLMRRCRREIADEARERGGALTLLGGSGPADRHPVLVIAAPRASRGVDTGR
ncbi:hypothetical protein EMIHUDRAFT_249849 [Emiliania huxleyi CCMP1516]|uniref:Sfi1 spindle body domain-containing protein n=2 Tax=Emiliania huxleyi TaxID=2903 RepID=A0A0D3I5F7_EMIH1|nr:hypothetical protein EMIHUDRAFT_249849 [Emiliania huxleyi CCMP1516]EOD06492.1 hypothetical protein EMIHUDRAFT_249849 [Emiliania huxleyi CCMP1516]|eukprot:XP_005758921.1 hypothetical protein EMIHUDRAFT_249849 [Emiliania huxleyi CCMP1516]